MPTFDKLEAAAAIEATPTVKCWPSPIHNRLSFRAGSC
jgi:hypothetical protein